MGDGRLARQGRQRRAVRSLPSLLIGPDELRLPKPVPFQSIQKLGFGRMVETGQYRVDCIELVKISMCADRWARATVAGAFPVIEPLHRSRGHATLRRAFRQTLCIRWYVLDDPV